MFYKFQALIQELIPLEAFYNGFDDITYGAATTTNSITRGKSIFFVFVDLTTLRKLKIKFGFVYNGGRFYMD